MKPMPTGPHGVVEVNPFANFTYNKQGKGSMMATNLDQQKSQNDSLVKRNSISKQTNRKRRIKKKSKILTRAGMRFWEPPRNNCRMTFYIKLRDTSPSLQATRRNSLLWTISIIHLPIHNLLAFQTSSCAALHRLSFSSPAPVSEYQHIIMRNQK